MKKNLNRKKRKTGFISALMVIGLMATVSSVVFWSVGKNENVIDNASNFYTVIFDTNGGETVPSEKISDGQRLSEPSTRLSGYDFLGWYSDIECTQRFDFLATPISGNITLYAKWGKKYNVVFETFGGSEVKTVGFGEGDMLSTPVQPTKSGYRFDGWYRDMDCSYLYDFSELINTDITLYARWIKVYTVDFNTCGDNSEVDSAVVDENSAVPMPAEPVRSGYEFMGWYLDETYVDEFDFGSPIDKDLTLYARWSVDFAFLYDFELMANDTYCVKALRDKSTAGSVEIPESYHGVVVTSIGGSAFYACRKITSVVIPNGVVAIGSSAFELCTSLMSVIIPNTVASIGSSAFYQSGLRTVEIPGSVECISASMFRLCSELYRVTILSGVTKIDQLAFSMCKKLSSIVIPETVNYIGEAAFDTCIALKTIVIPENITYIGRYAFNEWESTQNIRFREVYALDGWHKDWYTSSKAKITWGYTGI